MEAPDTTLAGALVDRLRTFETEVELHTEHADVVVKLTGQLEVAIVEALNGVDRWLVECEVPSTRVHVDGRAYTLTPPSPA